MKKTKKLLALLLALLLTGSLLVRRQHRDRLAHQAHSDDRAL